MRHCQPIILRDVSLIAVKRLSKVGSKQQGHAS